MKPLTLRSQLWTRRLAPVLIVLVLVAVALAISVNSGIAVRGVSQDNPIALSDQLVSASGVSGGKASGPRVGPNLQAADPTKPEIGYSISPALPNGLDSWYRSDVTVTWVITETESFASLTLDSQCGTITNNDNAGHVRAKVVINADQTAKFYTCIASSDGGTTTKTTTQSIKRDATPPSAPVVAATLPGGKVYEEKTWANKEVTVAFNAPKDATDNLSGFDRCFGTTTVPNEQGPGDPAVQGYCRDLAGNKAYTNFYVYVDMTKPNPPTAKADPGPNANGWNKEYVTVSFTGNGDAGPYQSGIAKCDAPKSIMEATAGKQVTGTCTDVAGNVSLASNTVTVKIDTNPPAFGNTTATSNGVPYIGGTGNWTKSPVIVTFQCKDDAANQVNSGVVASTITLTFGKESEGADKKLSAPADSCKDLAGNTPSVGADFTHAYIDMTPPNAPEAQVNPPANANGWNNQSTSPVTVTFKDKGDLLSGVASCTPSSTYNDETAGTPVSGTCTDRAGNVSAATNVTVKIDKTSPNPPQKGVPSPGPNGYGWNNTAVTVGFPQNGDNLSGGVKCADVRLESNTPKTGTDVTSTCTDAAGNVSAAGGSVNVKIDMIAPYYGSSSVGAVGTNAVTIIATATSNSLPYAADTWTNSDVIVTFYCSDSLSGPVRDKVVKTVTAEGITQAVTATEEDCTDLAGNAGLSPATFGPIKIDRTAPLFGPWTPGVGCAPPTPNPYDPQPGSGVNYSTLKVSPPMPYNGGYAVTATVADNVGNVGTSDPYPFTPYKGDGSLLLAPIHEKGDNVFKLGSVIPIKFRLIDCSDRPVTNADARLRVVYVGPSTPTHPQGPVENIGSPGNADTGNRFRYDNQSGQYIFNWGTKGLWVGEFEISVYIGELVFKGTTIGLR